MRCLSSCKSVFPRIKKRHFIFHCFHPPRDKKNGRFLFIVFSSIHQFFLQTVLFIYANVVVRSFIPLNLEKTALAIISR